MPEVILIPFATTVTTIILREYPEACLRNDFTELAHIISQFEAPGRIGEDDQGVYVCHWTPLLKGERKKLAELRKAAYPVSTGQEYVSTCRASNAITC